MLKRLAVHAGAVNAGGQGGEQAVDAGLAGEIGLDEFAQAGGRRVSVDGDDFRPLPGQQAEAHRQLVGAHTRYDCWPRGELPARWQYGSHRRIPAIICQMHEGWDANHRHILARRAPGVRGSHGYDIDLPSMRSPFIAHGPAFRRQAVIEPIANVDVYPLMTGLLGLSLPPNDGNPAATADALAR